MRGRRGRWPAVIAGALAALAMLLLLTLPPRALPPPGGTWTPSAGVATVRGVLHVHTRRSDGSGSVDDVARAAGRAGLDYVVLSDHGDATREPDPPTYRAGVLCIDAVEISTSGGHVLALGLPAAPFRLAGTPRDVVEDVARFGGLAIATHPDSPKPALAWRDWRAPLQGFEWLNADTEWRDESRIGLAAALVHYWFRGPETIASLFDRPATTLTRWDRLSAEGRPLIAVAGADAHARLGWKDEDAGENDREGRSLAVPSYETVFRAATTIVEVEQRFTGGAETDAALLLGGLAAGRTYSVIDAFARGGRLAFSGEANGRPVAMGARVPPGALTRLTVRVRAPAAASLRLLRNGVVLASSSGLALDVSRDELDRARRAAGGTGAAAYRVEVVIQGRGGSSGMPWLLGNPIWELPDGAGGAQGTDLEAAHGHLTPLRDLASALHPAGWAVETDPRSDGQLSGEAAGTSPGLRLEFRLGDQHGNRWVAAVHRLDTETRALLRARVAISVRLRASRPMRVGLQLRADAPDADLRWTRSLFVSPDARTIAVPLASFAPVGADAEARNRDEADALLVVVDGTHSEPGRRGTVWIEGLAVSGVAGSPGR